MSIADDMRHCGYDGWAMEVERLEAERDGWVESARHFANGQEFYQGIVRQVGNLFGEAAYTSDDGSVQDDVLALKVPELVEALAAHLESTTGLLSHIVELWGMFERGEELPDNDDAERWIAESRAALAEDYRRQAEGDAQ